MHEVPPPSNGVSPSVLDASGRNEHTVHSWRASGIRNPQPLFIHRRLDNVLHNQWLHLQLLETNFVSGSCSSIIFSLCVCLKRLHSTAVCLTEGLPFLQHFVPSLTSASQAVATQSALVYLLNILGKETARCWWRSWLRHCASSRKVAGSIPDGVIENFSLT